MVEVQTSHLSFLEHVNSYENETEIESIFVFYISNVPVRLLDVTKL